MEIRKPKFELGQKVVDKYGNVITVIKFNSYHFEENEYWYDVSYDGEVLIKKESFLEPCAEKPKSVWDLEDGEVYYYISNDYAGVMSTNWTNSMCDCGRRAVGNAFMDSDDAFHDLQRQKIEAEMLKLGGRRTFNYYESENWNIKADASGGLIIQSGYCLQTASVIYFKSKEDAEIAISEIGEDRIKKYIFGVK